MTNEKNNLSTFNFATLWFGAAVSIAEIMTGGFIAPLGFAKGLAAILLGHLIGTTALVLAGFIGTSVRMPSIKSTRISFGEYGSFMFSIFNIIQLIGWTTVMIITGARSVNLISTSMWSFNSMTFWSIFIGILVFVWIAFGQEGWKKLNNVAVILLFVLTIVLSIIVLKSNTLMTTTAEGTISFGGAVELSAVMPLSWLPLIADYTRFAKTKKAGVVGSFAGYFLGSSWMYVIGLGAAIVTKSGDPAEMMVTAHLGFAAIGIVILATVTTTFMDVYSAGVSSLNIFPKLNEKKVALIMGAIGTALALIINMESYETFLYAIGSVFAPMFAVLITDFFLYKRIDSAKDEKLVWTSLIVWAIGVAAYYEFLKFDFILGATVPAMITTIILQIIVKEVLKKWN